MNSYIISYDLIQGKDYTRLKNAIKSRYSYWAKPLDSLWVVKTDDSVAEIRSYLQLNVDYDDKLFVVNITGLWASFNLTQEVVDWLKINI